MSQQLPEGLQTHIGHAKEVEFQHANDRVVHVLPLGEVVAQPVTPVLPAADEGRPTQDKRPLASCLLGSTAKKIATRSLKIGVVNKRVIRSD